MEDKILREEELSGVGGGLGERSFATVAEDFVRLNRCDACPYRNRDRRYHYGMCTQEYSRLLMEWSGPGAADIRCKRK